MLWKPILLLSLVLIVLRYYSLVSVLVIKVAEVVHLGYLCDLVQSELLIVTYHAIVLAHVERRTSVYSLALLDISASNLLFRLSQVVRS